MPSHTLATVLSAAALTAIIAAPAAAQASDPSRLYGRVETVDGSVYQGFIRWDGNEAGWYDILHATKDLPARNRRDAERLGWEPDRRERRFELFGIGITIPESESEIPSSTQSGLRLGHISSLEVTGSRSARVLLRSGDEIEFDGGGDLGGNVDGILVDDPRRGQVELDWRDVRVIDFMVAPDSPTTWGDRLYGTLVTRDGTRFTGYVVWDMDELYSTDVLDGEDRGRDREIPFSRIRVIERFGSSAARVTMQDGSEVVLRGSNDVDDDNRDIMIADPGLGEIRVEWEELDRVEFEPGPTGADLREFGRAGPLRGTVRARGGESHTGQVRWDNDEEFGWEYLDGELYDGVSLDIEFGAIRSIERVAYDASRITLRDGRTFDLTGSNDVNEENKGVYIERSDGTLVLVPWDRFERVDLDP